MTKHTCGPWQSKSDFDREDRLTIIGNVDGEYVDGVPRCTYTDVCQVEDNDEAIANAWLIAAAPELLAAAKAGLARMMAELDRIYEAHCLLNEDLTPKIETLEEAAREDVAQLEREIKQAKAAIYSTGTLCKECDGMTFVRRDGQERACPACQTKAFEEEERELRAAGGQFGMGA